MLPVANSILDSNVNHKLKAFLKPILTWDTIQQSIVDIIASKADLSEFSTITQSEISQRANISPSQVSLHVKELVKHGHLEIERRGTYHVIHHNILQRGATKAVLSYLLACTTNPACLQFTLEQLSAYTGLSTADLELAKNYVYEREHHMDATEHQLSM